MIELKFPLNITLDSPSPIFKASINGIAIKCMLDTGADLPVFCKGTKLFKELVKDVGGVTEFKKSFIGGFGKENESTTLWHIGEFCLSDYTNQIIYKGLKMAVLNKPNIPCDMILSASMFMKMKYSIDCTLPKHTLTIFAAQDTYGVGFYNKRETIYIFSEY